MLLPGRDVFICGCACGVWRISRFTGPCYHSNPISSISSTASTTPTNTVDHKRECDSTQWPGHIHYHWQQFHSRCDRDSPLTVPRHFVRFRPISWRAQRARRHHTHSRRKVRDGLQHRDRLRPESRHQRHRIARLLGGHTVPAATQSAERHV